MSKNFSAYKGTARCFFAETKIRGGNFFVKTLKNLRSGVRGRAFPGCNITTVRAPKQALGADWSGRERTLVRKRLPCCILRQKEIFHYSET